MSSPRDLGARRLAALWKRSREPIFLLDPAWRLAYVNPSWETLTGTSAESVLGLRCRARGQPGDGPLDELAQALYPPPEVFEGRPAGSTTLVVRPDGRRLWHRVEYWPYHDESGEPLGVFGLIRPAEAPHHAPDSEGRRLQVELDEVREKLRARHGSEPLIGRGPVHRRVLGQVEAAGAISRPVLIVGEPGVGKRTVAGAIHRIGPKPDAPLLPFDCAALPPEVLERELFDQFRPSSATLLLIEVLALPRDLQVRLADAIETGPRVIGTSTTDPTTAVRDDRIRPDLYHALTTLVIPLSPLRERLDDLPLLAQAFLERANGRGPRRRQGFRPEALALLLAHDWPGNLRELARVVEAAHARGDSDLIGPEDIPTGIRGHLGAAYAPPPSPATVVPLDEQLTAIERHLIEEALTRARGNKSRAADLLGVSRPRLYRRIKELGLPEGPEAVGEMDETS